MSLIDQVWALFEEWCERSFETGTLELDRGGSGGVRMSEWQGDHDMTELVVSWGTLEEAVALLRADIDGGFPRMRAFLARARPRGNRPRPVSVPKAAAVLQS